eukprot:TRINITY_DN7275_c2_g1_i1.p1 TRINITY_DN7275_c2_g1~~TRINITY_DN7275_c2_g1_i1.p1  ORF type:complete len:786 (-),score=107.06 TRINITY_DN7275_c2_g1_i1:6-2363(-)
MDPHSSHHVVALKRPTTRRPKGYLTPYVQKPFRWKQTQGTPAARKLKHVRILPTTSTHMTTMTTTTSTHLPLIMGAPLWHLDDTVRQGGRCVEVAPMEEHDQLEDEAQDGEEGEEEEEEEEEEEAQVDDEDEVAAVRAGWLERLQEGPVPQKQLRTVFRAFWEEETPSDAVPSSLRHESGFSFPGQEALPRATTERNQEDEQANLLPGLPKTVMPHSESFDRPTSTQQQGERRSPMHSGTQHTDNTNADSGWMPWWNTAEESEMTPERHQKGEVIQPDLVQHHTANHYLSPLEVAKDIAEMTVAHEYKLLLHEVLMLHLPVMYAHGSRLHPYAPQVTENTNDGDPDLRVPPVACRRQSLDKSIRCILGLAVKWGIWTDDIHLFHVSNALMYVRIFRDKVWVTCPLHPAAFDEDNIRSVIGSYDAADQPSVLTISIFAAMAAGARAAGAEITKILRLQVGHLFQDYISSMRGNGDVDFVPMLLFMAFLTLLMDRNYMRARHFIQMGTQICRANNMLNCDIYLRCLYASAFFTPTATPCVVQDLYREINRVKALPYHPPHSLTPGKYGYNGPLPLSIPSLHAVNQAYSLLYNIGGVLASKDSLHNVSGMMRPFIAILDQLERSTVHCTKEDESLSLDHNAWADMPAYALYFIHLNILALRAECHWHLGEVRAALSNATQYLTLFQAPDVRELIPVVPTVSVVVDIFLRLQEFEYLQIFLNAMKAWGPLPYLAKLEALVNEGLHQNNTPSNNNNNNNNNNIINTPSNNSTGRVRFQVGSQLPNVPPLS